MLFNFIDFYIYYILIIYRIVGYFLGGNFCEFHESTSIRKNFTLKMFLFSKQSVTIHENFSLEKLEKLNSRKFPPQKLPVIQ